MYEVVHSGWYNIKYELQTNKTVILDLIIENWFNWLQHYHRQLYILYIHWVNNL